MAVACQCLEVFRFPVMQSTFCFPSIEIITVPVTSLINYFRIKGAVESVFVGEKRLNSSRVSENNLRIKTTVELSVFIDYIVHVIRNNATGVPIA